MTVASPAVAVATERARSAEPTTTPPEAAANSTAGRVSIKTVGTSSASWRAATMSPPRFDRSKANETAGTTLQTIQLQRGTGRP